jgi:methyl-accepting chemotaxis protein
MSANSPNFRRNNVAFLLNAKVGTKLFISSGLGIFLIFAMIANQQISNHMITEATLVVTHEQTIQDGVAGAELALSQMRFADRAIQFATSKEEVQAALDGVKTAGQQTWDGLETPISIALRPDVLKDIRNNIRDYQRAIEAEALARSAAIEKSSAQTVIVSADDAQVAQERRSAIVKAASAAIDQCVINVLRFTDEAKHARDLSMTAASQIGIVLGATVVVVLIISAFFLMTSIGRPIRSMTEVMRKLADGDTSSFTLQTARKDEIGEMAGAVETFRLAAISNKRLEAEAEASRIEAEADRIWLTAEAEAAAQRRLQEATSSLALGLKRLAGGEVSFELKEPFAPDFESLRHDLNAVVAQLGLTLRSVAQATNSIDTGTREISRSAEDLSKRTEQQAASLEETAAALDQITVNVSNSSKRADEARAVAVQANTSAAQSGKVVANAVDAMQRIEQSSKQISSIIGVIDEIAFQTNLLALNAGVEAARAGEAGRGFAVVAQEVRELAQRSAKAAKEIKDLISTSTSEVESGVKLVRDTGGALRTIEEYVVTINHHMDAIATSAREQSTGLAEVNTAVNQMDQVTQQNAAMVEETNAASASLANEAGRLRELISHFDFGGEDNEMPRVAVRRQITSAKGSPVQALPDHRPVASPARKMAS